MDTSDDDVDDVLLQRARAGLAAGERLETVFAALAVDTPDYRPAALAVCAAVGVPRAQALQRWSDIGDPLTLEIGPGEAADFGAFLEMAGFFDVHRPLDEREQRVGDQLGRAFAATGGLPSGYAHSLGRLLQTGRVTDAFISMATFGDRRSRGIPAAYWTHLLAAADLLTGADDDRFAPCVDLCRRHLDQAGAPPPPPADT